MDDRPAEEQHVARIHDDRYSFQAVGQRNLNVGEADIRIRLFRTHHWKTMATWHNPKAAVFLIATVDRHPSGHTRARLRSQVELVLVEAPVRVHPQV